MKSTIHLTGVVGAVAGKEADEEQRQVAVGRRRPPSCPAGEENGGPFGIALRPASGAVLLLHRPNDRKQLCSASGAAENPLRGEERENRSQKKKNELQPAPQGAVDPVQGVGQICPHRDVRARGCRCRS